MSMISNVAIVRAEKPLFTCDSVGAVFATSEGATLADGEG